MKRKAGLTAPAVAMTTTNGPPSPGAGTGDMDTLLAKLRAAKPEARDQRDRRRRARLKDRHADRVASGQKIPELAELVNDNRAEHGLLSPVKSEAGSSTGTDDGPLSAGLSVSDDEDVTARAEKLLQGLGDDSGDEVGGVPTPRDSIRMSRRRKEGAVDERAARRRRRQLALSASESSLENHMRDSVDSSVLAGSTEGGGHDAIPEEDEEEGGETPKPVRTKEVDVDVVVSPPSPEGRRALPTPPPGD